MRPRVRMAVYFVTVAMGRGRVRHVSERSHERFSIPRHGGFAKDEVLRTDAV